MTGHGTGAPAPDCERGRTPRTLLGYEHGADVATTVARSTSASLVVLMVDDEGVLVVAITKPVGPEGVAEHCDRLLAHTQPVCDFAVLVTLDVGLNPSTEAVREAWLDTHRRFGEAGVELANWLVVEGDTRVSMAGSGSWSASHLETYERADECIP